MLMQTSKHDEYMRIKMKKKIKREISVTRVYVLKGGNLVIDKHEYYTQFGHAATHE